MFYHKQRSVPTKAYNFMMKNGKKIMLRKVKLQMRKTWGNKRLARVVLGGILAASVVGMNEPVFAANIYATSGNPVTINKAGQAVAYDVDRSSSYKLEGNNRYAAVAANGGDVAITAATITITGGTQAADDQRIYGIASESGRSITINGNTGISVKVDGAIDSDKFLQARGVRNNDGGTITFNGDTTVEAELKNASNGGNMYVTGLDAWDGAQTIFNGNAKVSSTGSSATSGNALWVNALQVSGSTVSFNGTTTELSAANTGYTAQAINAMGGSTVNLNSAKTTIKATSDYGANGIGFDFAGNDTVNFTKGDVEIDAVITDGVGATNAIGILGGNNNISVADAVNNFTINVEGAGVDTGNMGYSNGTAGLYSTGGTIDIKAKQLNINVTTGQNTANSTFDKAQADAEEAAGKTYSDSFGIRSDCGANINVGAATTTNIIVNDGYKNAVGIYAGPYAQYASDGPGNVSILGDATISAVGKASSKALWAKDGGVITVGSDGKTISLTGEILADAGTVNLSGNTTFDAAKVSFTNVNSGAINLKAGNMTGVFNITGGSVNIDGAAVTTHDFSKITPARGLVLSSGSLTTTSGLIFTNGIDTTSDDTVLASKDSGVVSNDKVALTSGNLILDDSKYNVDYVTTATAALKTAGATTLTMAGTLVSGATEQTTITPAAASAIGGDTVLDKVTVKDDGNNLIIGTATVPTGETVDGVALTGDTTTAKNGFGAKTLDLGAGSTGAIITNNQNVTLGGSAGGEVLTVDGAADSNLKLVVGANTLLGDATSTSGSLTIGDSLVTKDTNLNLTGSIVLNTNGQLNVNGNTTVTDGISAGGGNIAVGTGTLNTALELTGGNNTLTGAANLSSLTSTPDAVLEIGTTSATSQVSIANAVLNGATLKFDPAWTEAAAQNAITYAGAIDSLTAIGSNEYVTIGSTDTTEAATMFANTGLTFGEGNVESVLYLKGNQTLDSTKGSLTVNGTTVSAAGNFTANANSLTMVDGSAASSGTAALSGVTSTTVSDSAKLYINGAATGNTYTILAGSGITAGWANANILTSSKVISFTGTVSDSSFIVTSELNSVANVFGGAVITPNAVDKALTSSGTAAYAFLNSTVDSNVYATNAGTINAINSLANMGELAGVQHGAYTAGNSFADMVSDHLSFAGHAKSEHDVWANYINNKETVSDMSLGGMNGNYDLKYNGVVIGSDLYTKNDTTAGVAVMYAKGDVTGSITTNDTKYYGLSFYGRKTNGKTNILADVTYLHGSNDITQTNTGTVITASPKADAFSLGVKAEQRYDKGNMSIVPYAGLRYLHLGVGKYTNSLGIEYDPDAQNMFLLPIGVKAFGEIKSNDWTFRPKAQLGYVWTMGHRNSSQNVKFDGASDEFSYDTADSGYFLGGLGFEAEKGKAAYSVNYQYKKGSSTKNNIWMVQARFAF